MSSVNSGIKRVLTLRKYINGQATSETKQNLPSDPDYIADYEDLVDCPIGQGTTTTTTTTLAPGETTTTTTSTSTTSTTTLPQNFTDQTLTITGYTPTGGVIIEGNYSYSIYGERTFYVPAGTGPFRLSLTATFTTGLSQYSARALVVKSDSSQTIRMGLPSTSTEAAPHVAVSSGDTYDNVTQTSISLSDGYWKMQIYDVKGPSQGTFGNTVFTVQEE